MLFRALSTTPLQIICKVILFVQINLICTVGPDDNFRSTSWIHCCIGQYAHSFLFTFNHHDRNTDKSSFYFVQYRHLFPAPVIRTSVSAWLLVYKHQIKPRSIVSHPCPRNWVAIERAVLYYAWATQTFSAGIKCRHCSWMSKILLRTPESETHRSN